MKALNDWLEQNHPDLLKEAVAYILGHPGWDLMDATDHLNSGVYNDWCNTL